MKKATLLPVLCLSLGLYSQDTAHKKLDYMSDGNMEKAIQFSKEQNRPILIYFNSVDCHGCEKFSAEVMSSDSVIKALKNKYICVNAAVETSDGKKYSNRYKVSNLPQLVLVTPDLKANYLMEMKLNKRHTIRQALNFLNVGGMRTQVLLLQSTKHITWDQACTEMGASYARIDFRKNPEGKVFDMVYDRTLNMDIFKKLNDAYIDEWAIQKRKRKMSE